MSFLSLDPGLFVKHKACRRLILERDWHPIGSLVLLNVKIMQEQAHDAEGRWILPAVSSIIS